LGILIREQNKPVVSRPIDYYAGQNGAFFQKLEGLFFTFEDEEKLSIVDVRSRVMANFEKNAEVVTKRFYEKFEKDMRNSYSFIKGIQSKVDQNGMRRSCSTASCSSTLPKRRLPR